MAPARLVGSTTIANAFRSTASFCLAGSAFICLFATAPVHGAPSEGLAVSQAWVPATDEAGHDVPLLATITNEVDSPDALMRIRCPVANFSEKHTVDRGEGAPAMRSVSSIPIPAHSTVVLKPNEISRDAVATQAAACSRRAFRLHARLSEGRINRNASGGAPIPLEHKASVRSV